MPKHIHADLMMKAAKLAEEDERWWANFQCRGKMDEEWRDCSHGFVFWSDTEYRLKPRTIRIGNIEVPEPVREPLEYDTKCFQPVINCLGGAVTDWFYWKNSKKDNERLENGLIHLDRESAELHVKALISLTKEDKKINF
ncbi:hypothetical protein [Xenorhabdus bovienii]|uniref:hypothetical protein n=1 Tax=Xenorhabdus bovienii TaxID=40576 RepID=UPI0023B239B5|nr:hypothetical protein [Xenorhabdus bovienii]MDE9588220.1 hypothetical protein [Xenorhabdus bovienii]